MITPIERHQFEAAQLIRDHPPRWNARNKLAVFEIAKSASLPFEGEVAYARWPEESLPDCGPVDAGEHSVKKGFFQFQAAQPGVVTWHMNFADPELFFAYGSGLLAQDELQVAEHPILGSLRDALEANGAPPRAVDRKTGRPTPVTITGIQRRCAINTGPSPNCPQGLYGNAFARATEEEVRRATKALNPPTVSNILAIAAPCGGHGRYTTAELNDILITAYSGFRAARQESLQIGSPEDRVQIHTGFWGCGAFGGNRHLMVILQGYAANLAGVELVFWSPDDDGLVTIRAAQEVRSRLEREVSSPCGFLESIERLGYEWGTSDGN